MPIKRMLEQTGNLDPKAVATLLKAFEAVVNELRCRAPEERQSAAKIVIRLALSQTNLDASRLRHEAIASVRNESGPQSHRSSASFTRLDRGTIRRYPSVPAHSLSPRPICGTLSVVERMF